MAYRVLPALVAVGVFACEGTPPPAPVAPTSPPIPSARSLGSPTGSAATSSKPASPDPPAPVERTTTKRWCRTLTGPADAPGGKPYEHEVCADSKNECETTGSIPRFGGASDCKFVEPQEPNGN